MAYQGENLDVIDGNRPFRVMRSAAGFRAGRDQHYLCAIIYKRSGGTILSLLLSRHSKDLKLSALITSRRIKT
jgi:hypothetical protein